MGKLTSGSFFVLDFLRFGEERRVWARQPGSDCRWRQALFSCWGGGRAGGRNVLSSFFTTAAVVCCSWGCHRLFLEV